MTSLLALGVLGLGLSACGGPAAEQAEEQEAGTAAAGDVTQVSIAAVSTSCLQFFPLYVALDEGIYEANGLDVQIERMNGSGAVLQAMLAGQTELGLPGPVPTILTQAEGEDVKYVANLTPGGVFALVAPESTGISSAAELEGRTIGVATADGSEVSFVHTIMAAEGLSEEDYEILVVGEGGQAVAGFQREDIDGYAASMDGVATIEHAGIPLTNVTGDATDYLLGNGLAAPGDYIEQNPDVIAAFGRSYREAYELSVEDHDLISETCGRHQPQETEDPEYVTAHLEAVMPSMERSDGEPWGHMSEENWERILQDAVTSGDVEEGQVEVDQLFTNEFVEDFNS